MSRSWLLLWVFQAVLFSESASLLSGLTGYYYKNSAFGGKPAFSRIDPMINFSWPSDQPLGETPFTVRWKGNVSVSLVNPTFMVTTEGAVRLWVCDHLMIDDWSSAHTKNVSDQGIEPLQSKTAPTACPIVVEYGHFSGNGFIQLYWKAESDSSYQLVPTSVLEPLSSFAENQRQALRDKQLNSGWGTWYNKNMLSHVLLPHSFAVNIQLVSGNDVLKELTVFRTSPPAVHPVAHSYEGSQYTEVSVLNFSQTENITVKSTLDGDNLLLLVETTGSDQDALVQLVPTMYWERVGDIKMDPSSGQTHGTFPGLSDVFIFSTEKPTAVNSELLIANFSFSNGSIGFSSGKPYDKTTIASAIAMAANSHASRRVKYGNLEEVYNAMQTVVAWNTIYDPHEGIVIPVSRSWDFGAGYVLFDWDNYFVSYMAAIDNCDLAHSSVIQITKAKTVNGLIPNFSSGTRKSRDRTEPPIGAKVTWEIYQKCNETWLIELLYDDLFDWNTWFVENRLLVPDKLICLGSDPTAVKSGSENNLQDARYESGLDNSPMYDSPPVEYDNVSHHMLMYDVGMASMFLMECQMLMKMAELLNYPDDVKLLQDRYNDMAQKVQDKLWNSDVGLYVNRISTDDTFYIRFSPTLFYPMLAGLPSKDQVSAMMKHMTNNSEFCVLGSDDTEQLKTMVPLILVNSESRKDNCLCASVRCSHDQAGEGYRFIDYEGLIQPAYSRNMSGMVALNLFYSSEAQDNFVTTLTTLNDSSYSFIQLQGYCYEDKQDSSSLQLQSWYHNELHDHVACATEACKSNFSLSGYKLLRNECWVEPAMKCIYAMPSIDWSDSAFFDQNYWRGRIWGPMVQLIYWGLQQYAGIPEVDDARKALCAQAEGLLMKEWRENCHVHENYNAILGIGSDVRNSDPFYHWGALNGFISLLEGGYF
jgi:hypothetical protein